MTPALVVVIVVLAVLAYALLAAPRARQRTLDRYQHEERMEAIDAQSKIARHQADIARARLEIERLRREGDQPPPHAGD